MLLVSLVQETYGSVKLYEQVRKSLDAWQLLKAVKEIVDELTVVLKYCGVLGRPGWASTLTSTVKPA